MTRGGSPSVTPSKPALSGWSQGGNVSSTQQSGPQPDPVPTAPGVPGKAGSGSGSTVVSTPSIDVFASNIQQLIAPVNSALAKLKALGPLAPGGFNEAYTLTQQVSDSGSSGGAATDLVHAYQNVLHDLADGLTDLNSAATTMSQKYKTADDLNNMKVSDLQAQLDDTTGDLNAMMTANGGTSAAPAGGSGSGGGSGGSGGGPGAAKGGKGG